MKTTRLTTLALVTSAIAMIGTPGTTNAAAVTPVHGSACAGARANTFIATNASGIRNLDQTSARSVVCPIARAPGLGRTTIYIDGHTVGTATVHCTAYSRDYRNGILGTQTFVLQGEPFEAQFSFSYDEAPVHSRQSVVCKLPPAVGDRAQATIYGLHVLTEQE